ncbi:hypothetical protein CROQUDRAFT_722233 [Cronartium quercuum f. sp. fusiforme G11]|uniref:Uncharacterized protein n=1 Tax=Cronartium quercuum f. sp. fusiforme G11 TaxID=708437 RepID=A0A9P6NNW7_9BASI|nr:hypothetical protein CROQUDRAFT_722233 [Cronartium quercuum f. sp. fusiforme G11]
MCYNYLLQQDGCVYGSSDSPCPEDKSHKKACSSGSVFKHPHASPRDHNDYSSAPTPKKMRRYDTTSNIFYVDGGQGTCGFYNTTSQLGVCIWDGPEDVSDPTKAGWLNGGLSQNCNKQVYIQRENQPETVQYVPILDSCSFNSTAPEFSCFQTYVTKALFDLFEPTAYELETGSLYNLTWDFNNPINSGKLDNAPI